MSDEKIYFGISYVHPVFTLHQLHGEKWCPFSESAVLCGKSSKVGQYAQTFQPVSFIPALDMGTIIF